MILTADGDPMEEVQNPPGRIRSPLRVLVASTVTTTLRHGGGHAR